MTTPIPESPLETAASHPFENPALSAAVKARFAQHDAMRKAFAAQGRDRFGGHRDDPTQTPPEPRQAILLRPFKLNHQLVPLRAASQASDQKRRDATETETS